MAGDKVGVSITVYEDRSYDFVVKTPPVTGLILKAAGVEKGSGKNATTKAGKITRAQALEIAKKKMSRFECQRLPRNEYSRSAPSLPLNQLNPQCNIQTS